MKFSSRLIPIIQKYGKENGYSIIFGKSDVLLLYASESLDITDKITPIYDAEYKNKPQNRKSNSQGAYCMEARLRMWPG